jgi:hypothetical protein
VIAPHFLAAHAFVFVIPGSVASENQEHRMRRSVVEVNPAPNSAWAGGVSQAPLSETTMRRSKMRLLGKTAIVLGMAGAMALGSMTASQARWRAGPAAAAGFVAGAAIGAAAANANAGYYYGSGGYGYDSYAYEPAYSGYGYAYEPAYVAPAPVYTPPSYYGPVGGYEYSGYNTNYTGPWSERRLQGRD